MSISTLTIGAGERAGTIDVEVIDASHRGALRRTKAHWALEVAGLLEGRYAECVKVIPGVRQPEHAHPRSDRTVLPHTAAVDARRRELVSKIVDERMRNRR